MRATNETNWLHTDSARAARESPCKSLVVPGSLLLSLVPSLLPELLVLVGWQTAVNSGVETCRFDSLTPVGARVRMTATLGKGRSLPGAGCRIPIDVHFESDRGGDSACDARVVYIYYP